MNIDPAIRIFITGKTQSGKTFLAKKLLSMYQNRLIYDIKREYGELGTVVRSIADLDRAFKGGCNRVVYQPFDLSIDHFDEVCAYVVRNLRNIVFCVDEVHKFATKNKISYHFNYIVTVMQSMGVGVIGISQRPANVHNDIISSSTLIIAFRINLKTDAEAVTGIPADTIMSLPFRHFAVFDDRIENGLAIVHKPI